jgi:hypothetical protein
MHTQPALIVEDLEATPTGAAGVVMEDELIDHIPQLWQLPSVGSRVFQAVCGNGDAASESVSIGGFEGWILSV